MLVVSDAFRTAIKNTVRKMKAKVQVTWSDPVIDAGITTTASSINRIDFKAQTIDTIENTTHKWFYINPQCTLNGTFYPAPSAAEASIAQMGLFSQQQNSSKTFSPYITLTHSFSARVLKTINVAFDDSYGEYAEAFNIYIYKGSYTLYQTITITGNTSLTYVGNFTTPISDVTRIVLEVRVWSVANVVAKISEFSFNATETYTEDISSLGLLEEKEIRDGSIPVGNISSNELDLSLNNIRVNNVLDPFYFSNPLSAYSAYMLPGRKVKAWIGVELPSTDIEYVPLGTFWSGDWDVEEVSNTAATTCRDRLDKLRNINCKGEWMLKDSNLYNVALRLMSDIITTAPMPDLKYNISTDLTNFTVSYGYFPIQSFFQCVKDIAFACGGVAYMDRNDVLVIEKGY